MSFNHTWLLRKRHSVGQGARKLLHGQASIEPIVPCDFKDRATATDQDRLLLESRYKGAHGGVAQDDFSKAFFAGSSTVRTPSMSKTKAAVPVGLFAADACRLQND
uniref:Uncharacterized protein n=1 Tax=Dunaliella tertiolecta TaxID=3047 RepID=A0A7S3QWK2_DUNTE